MDDEVEPRGPRQEHLGTGLAALVAGGCLCLVALPAMMYLLVLFGLGLLLLGQPIALLTGSARVLTASRPAHGLGLIAGAGAVSSTVIIWYAPESSAVLPLWLAHAGVALAGLCAAVSARRAWPLSWRRGPGTFMSSSVALPLAAGTVTAVALGGTVLLGDRIDPGRLLLALLLPALLTGVQLATGSPAYRRGVLIGAIWSTPWALVLAAVEFRDRLALVTVATLTGAAVAAAGFTRRHPSLPVTVPGTPAARTTTRPLRSPRRA